MLLEQTVEIGNGIKAGPGRDIGNAVSGLSKLMPGIFQPFFV